MRLAPRHLLLLCLLAGCLETWHLTQPVMGQERTASNRRRATPTIPDTVEAHRDLAYAGTGDSSSRQRLDLYLPKSRPGKALPVVIWVHGGGWRQGDRYPCPALFLTDHGFAVASLGYRLSDTAIFPAQIVDCKLAVAFLRDQADEYGLDATRFGVWGSSAGGHLVALLGTSGNAAELSKALGLSARDSRVQAVCDYFGPTDLLKMSAQSDDHSRIDHDAADSPESKLLGGPLQDQVELAQQASPLSYVDADDPPFLIVHGDQDPLVPHQQSRDLHAALTAAGVKSELVIVPGGGHGPFREPDQLQRVREFFENALR